MEALTYIELDIPVCSLTYGTAPCTASIPTTGPIKCFNSKKTCQDTPHFSESTVTLRFAKPTDYLVDAGIECIPSISDVSFTPASISLGENLGTRATLSVTFLDHPDADATANSGFDKYLSDRTYDPFSQGTFWGKFRARQPFLRGRSIRWIAGLVGDDLAEMETRHYFIDSFDGPTPDGKYTIIAKDLLKFADGDRAQAPALSNGFLVADISNSVTSATLSPSGIGNLEYPAAGFATLGGNEVVLFTRSADVLTMTRAQFGSTASAHKAQDRVQQVLSFTGADAGNILWNLLTVYAGIDPSYINLSEWNAETAAFLGNVYTTNICEPTSVATLAAEIIKQANLCVWWDDIDQQLRLRVLRGIVTDAATFTPDSTLQGSLKIKEQPNTQITRVQVYFGQIDPTKPLSNLDNFRSTSVVIDDDAEDDYGAVVIETINSRFIPALGRTVADRLAAIRLGRFRDPPRLVSFDTMRYASTDIELGTGYRVESFCVQDASGAQSDIPVQITRLNPGPDRFSVEAQEMLFTAPAVDLVNRIVIIDADAFYVNLRSAHDSIYPAPITGDEVTCVINAGVVVGSGSTVLPAFDVGSWPAGVTLNLQILGRIEGRGGLGGTGGSASTAGPGQDGSHGGLALYTRYAINVDASLGGIWSGGGGGGGGGSSYLSFPGSAGGGGGGGAGEGYGGGGNTNGPPAGFGANGSRTAGGVGGVRGDYGGRGGNGGGPGLTGDTGVSGMLFPFHPGGAGGFPGLSIDGISFVTFSVPGGDIRGTTAN